MINENETKKTIEQINKNKKLVFCKDMAKLAGLVKEKKNADK